MGVGKGGGGGVALPDFFFCSLFPVQQTTSGIGHRVNKLSGSGFRVGNQYIQCEKQQQTTTTSALHGGSNIFPRFKKRTALELVVVVQFPDYPRAPQKRGGRSGWLMPSNSLLAINNFKLGILKLSRDLF